MKLTLGYTKTLEPKKPHLGTPINRRIFGFDLKNTNDEEDEEKDILPKSEKEDYED